MKSETAEFAMSQRTNKGGVPNADDWTSEGGVTFAFTNQLESVSSQDFYQLWIRSGSVGIEPSVSLSSVPTMEFEP